MFRRISTALLVFAAVIGGARAEVPIALPAGESAADWVEVLELAGLHEGPVTGRGIAVTVLGADWKIDVSDGRGTTRSTTMPAPADAPAREELIFVTKALLAGIDAGPVAAPVVVESREIELSAPATEAPIRASRPAPPPRPAPYVVPPAEPVVTAPPPRYVPPPRPTRPAPRVRPPVRERKPVPIWLDFEVVGAVRADAGSTLLAGSHVGVSLGSWDVGVGARGGSRHTLTKLERDRSMGDVSLQALASKRWNGVRGRATGGVALRRFYERRESVGQAWVPQAAVDVAWSGLGVFRIEPFVGIGADLRPVRLQVNGVPVQSVFPVSVALGVRTVFRGKAP